MEVAIFSPSHFLIAVSRFVHSPYTKAKGLEMRVGLSSLNNNNNLLYILLHYIEF